MRELFTKFATLARNCERQRVGVVFLEERRVGISRTVRIGSNCARGFLLCGIGEKRDRLDYRMGFEGAGTQYNCRLKFGSLLWIAELLWFQKK